MSLIAREKLIIPAAFAAIGPGLVVMLADTDAGSVLTAAQTGVETGYALIPFQLAVIPILYAAQELASRLALGTGQGRIELIRARLGRGAGIAVTGVLAITCFGALVTQLSGMAAVAELAGVPVAATLTLAVVALSTMVLTGSYRSVERIALLFGAAEFDFLFALWKAHPDFSRIAADAASASAHSPRFLYLVAANLGATLMPWALFYQQSAACDKGLSRGHLGHARLDTLLGAILCQVVTCGVQIVAATQAAEASRSVIPDGGSWPSCASRAMTRNGEAGVASGGEVSSGWCGDSMDSTPLSGGQGDGGHQAPRAALSSLTSSERALT